MIAGLLFMAGMRRSEVSALRWADVADGGGIDPSRHGTRRFVWSAAQMNHAGMPSLSRTSISSRLNSSLSLSLFQKLTN